MLGFIFSLFIATASAASYSCPVAVNGIPKLSSDTNIIKLCHENYLSEYSTKEKIPMVVTWSITNDELDNCNKRKGKFSQDPMANGEDVSPNLYKNTSYDRGHYSPAEDNLFDDDSEKESFYMTNMSPQNPGLNRGGWKWFEELTRRYAYQYGQVDVYTGVILTTNTYINGIRVPDYYWKVDYIPSQNKTISVIVPNAKIKGKDILMYITTKNDVERKANIILPLPKNTTQIVYDKNLVSSSKIRNSKSCPIE